MNPATPRWAAFARSYPVCNMLGLNPTHPRFALDRFFGDVEEDAGKLFGGNYRRVLRRVLPD